MSTTKTDGRPGRTRVLIADDDEALRRHLERTLETEGYDVSSVGDGETLRRTLEDASPGSRNVDVLVSDVQMPGPGGLEVLEWLRERERDWRLRVVLISGCVDRATWREARRLGAWDVLEKPLNEDRLRVSLRGALAPVPARRFDPDVEARATRMPRPRIVLAEDDDALRERLARELKARGVEVRTCRHGLELVAELDRTLGSDTGSGRVDAVIAESRMPGVTGMSVLEGLEALRSPRPPVVLLAALDDDAAHARAKRLRASAIFDRPLDVERVLDHIGALLELERRA